MPLGGGHVYLSRNAPVEIIRAADVGEDIAVRWIKRHDRRIGHIFQDKTSEPTRNRIFRDVLKFRIKRCANDVGKRLPKLINHATHKVRRLHLDPRRKNDRFRRACVVRVARRNDPGPDHAIENETLLTNGGVAMTHGIKPRRRWNHAGEQRAFAEGEIRDLLVKKPLRRGRDPTGSVAERHGVEIAFEGLFFRMRRVPCERDDDFARFFETRPRCARKIDLLHELHFDRACAAMRFSDKSVADRTYQCRQINAAMSVESSIFADKNGVDQGRRNAVKRNEFAALARHLIQQRAIACENFCRWKRRRDGMQQWKKTPCEKAQKNHHDDEAQSLHLCHV